MKYGREIQRLGAGLALLVSAAAGAAQPGEPLTVTQLGDPEIQLQRSTVSSNSAGTDGNVDSFSRAISETLRVQQQSIEDRCRTAPRESGAVAVRWAWEARCRYQRY